MADERTSGVHPLDELDDFKVADDDVDPRGWAVYSQDGQKLGEVKELLVDTAAMKVRYLDVELDRDIAGADRDNRHVLFPVGTARLDDGDDRVFVNAAAASVTGLPAYTRGGPVSRDYENSVRDSFVTAAGTTAGTAAAPGEVTAAELDYYNHDHYDTSRFYGNRARGADTAGEATGNATGEAGLASEAGAGTANDARMTSNEEQLLVSKRPVVREEIVIRKRAVVENQTVEADVRRERVDIDRDLAGPAGTSDAISSTGTATPGTYGTGGTMGDIDPPRGTGSDLSDATRRGANKAIDAVEDVKDRVDGNPASGPGRDATDRRP